MVNPKADSYQRKDPREHVLLRPDMYIGSIVQETDVVDWVAEFTQTDTGTTMQIVNRKVSYVPGLERVFLEGLTNASDNVGRSRRAKVDPGVIEIIMNNTTISIKNGGLIIPIERHPEEMDPDDPTSHIYVAKLIFGTLLTSSNYTDERHEAGTNGIGAKATNIFSREFMVIIVDAKAKLKYTQVWRDNMSVCDPAIIEKTTEKKSYVQIVYTPDFERFGQQQFETDDYCLYARHAADISVTSGVKVTFNGFEMNYDIREYARLIYGDAVNNAIIHYQWPENCGEIRKKPRGIQVAADPSITPEVVLVVVDTPDEGGHISFVNCMMTRDGGVHVNAAIKAVADPAIKSINEAVMKKLIKQNKGVEPDAKTKRAHTISLTDVKPHISVLLMVRVVNPRFTSQTKTCLSSPKVNIKVNPEELKPMEKWSLVERLNAALQAKQFARNAKTDGKLKRNVKLEAGIDANFAGTARRLECTLFITEGKSGAGYADRLVDIIAGGRDLTGVLPMKGKSLNVMNVSWDRISENAEISELKKMLGLIDCCGKNEIDTFYLDDKNFARLRYGHIRLMVDSDVDGKHIAGLILNFFFCRARSLLHRGYVSIYQTPTIKVWYGNSRHKFYSQVEYNAWKEKTPQFDKWEHQYYKGLGTSSPDDVKEDHPTNRSITFIYDDDTAENMTLAFHKKRSDDRKRWQAMWEPCNIDCNVREQTISDFINQELILFSLDDTGRSIPSITDSLKEGQRKLMHAVMKKWPVKIGANYKRLKVAHLAAITPDVAEYHHGEVSMSSTIIGMAQDFKCANTIAYFVPDGEFGSYYYGGKNFADPRYIFTRPSELLAYIFRREDNPILVSKIEEGKEIEPESYAPIIPMALVNGAEGIGTGWSVYIPCHGVLEVINWLKARLTGKSIPKLYPQYNRFTGKLEIIDRCTDSVTKKRRTIITTVINGAAVDITSSLDVETENKDKSDNTESTELNLVVSEEDEEPIVEDNKEVAVEDVVVNMDVEEMESYNHKYTMVSYGDFHVTDDETIVVTELPIGVFPLAYRRWLEKLVENKEVREFMDRCNHESPRFEIKGFTKTATHKNLHLRRCKGISNLVLLDENGKPRKYESTLAIMEEFFNFRCKMYEKRKQYLLRQIQVDLDKMQHKIQYIYAVIEKRLEIIGTSKEAIYPILDKMGIPREIYDKTKGSHFSLEEVDSLNSKIAKKREYLTEMEQLSIVDIWYNELEELETVYRKSINKPKRKINIVRK